MLKLTNRSVKIAEVDLDLAIWEEISSMDIGESDVDTLVGFDDFAGTIFYGPDSEVDDAIESVRELLTDKAEDYINENSDIIYYTSAMEFLSENDPSLSTSCGLAGDMGYDAGSLNSELLATILNMELKMEDIPSEIDSILDTIRDFFEDNVE